MWLDPKTDWTDEDRVTFEDMNRICGNINHIFPSAKLFDKYTPNHYVELQHWQKILSSIKILTSTLGLSVELPTEEVISGNFNIVEEITEHCKRRIDLIAIQKVATIYTGNDIVLGQSYVRGA